MVIQEQYAVERFQIFFFQIKITQMKSTRNLYIDSYIVLNDRQQVESLVYVMMDH